MTTNWFDHPDIKLIPLPEEGKILFIMEDDRKRYEAYISPELAHKLGEAILALLKEVGDEDNLF